jgi:hypothetical protein
VKRVIQRTAAASSTSSISCSTRSVSASVTRRGIACRLPERGEVLLGQRAVEADRMIGQDGGTGANLCSHVARTEVRAPR